MITFGLGLYHVRDPPRARLNWVGCSQDCWVCTPASLGCDPVRAHKLSRRIWLGGWAFGEGVGEEGRAEAPCWQRFRLTHTCSWIYQTARACAQSWQVNKAARMFTPPHRGMWNGCGLLGSPSLPLAWVLSHSVPKSGCRVWQRVLQRVHWTPKNWKKHLPLNVAMCQMQHLRHQSSWIGLVWISWGKTWIPNWWCPSQASKEE